MRPGGQCGVMNDDGSKFPDVLLFCGFSGRQL